MKYKYLRITMPDNTKWDVPANLIAASRARYYSKVDEERGRGIFHELYDKEFAYTMENPDELMDWAANNMNWEDVVHSAKPVKKFKPDTDYQEGWINGEKEIVEEY